jgi:hypothetical protein
MSHFDDEFKAQMFEQSILRFSKTCFDQYARQVYHYGNDMEGFVRCLKVRAQLIEVGERAIKGKELDLDLITMRDPKPSS